MAGSTSILSRRTLVLVGALIFCLGNLRIRAEDAAPSAESSNQTTTATTPSPALSDDQMKSLVAPIALYPDELLSQILVASTYPLEVVQAYQWLQQHPELKGHELTEAAAKENWDPSVQALVAFPDVMKRMTQDVTWMTHLGNAFLA